MTYLTEQFKKIKLKHKWRSGRKKVIKRYEEIMRNFPKAVFYEDGEDWDLYMQRLTKHLIFICRCMRLNHIAFRILDKERKFYERATTTSYSITAFWAAFVIGWFIGDFLR